MPGKLIVFATTFVILVCFIVSVVWLFVPIQKKNAMDFECRGVLLKMENSNCLKKDDKDNLNSRLTDLGLNVISIAGTTVDGIHVDIPPEYVVKKGDMLNLRVEAEYTYRSFGSVFFTKKVTGRMVYDRSTIARMVIVP